MMNGNTDTTVRPGYLFHLDSGEKAIVATGAAIDEKKQQKLFRAIARVLGNDAFILLVDNATSVAVVRRP